MGWADVATEGDPAETMRCNAVQRCALRKPVDSEQSAGFVAVAARHCCYLSETITIRATRWKNRASNIGKVHVAKTTRALFIKVQQNVSDAAGVKSEIASGLQLAEVCMPGLGRRDLLHLLSL